MLLGINEHRGTHTPVSITAEWATRHIGIFGATGTGKTTAELRFAQPRHGAYGWAYIDSNGDGAQDCLALIPPERLSDVVYFNPADAEFPIAFNLLEATSAWARPSSAWDQVKMPLTVGSRLSASPKTSTPRSSSSRPVSAIAARGWLWRK